MQRRFHVDVVVTQSAAVLELPAGEDEALHIRRNALLVLDLLLDSVDRVARLDAERDRLARHGLDENVHIGMPRKAELVPCRAASQGVFWHQFYHHQARFDDEAWHSSKRLPRE